MQLRSMLVTLLSCATCTDMEEPYHYTQLLQAHVHPGKKIIHDAKLEAQSDETKLLETSIALTVKHDKEQHNEHVWCRPKRCRNPYLDEGPRDAHNCSDALFDMLVSVSDTLTAGGYDWQLCQGTLLGAIRDKDLIPWSADVDVCLSEESFWRLRRSDVLKDNVFFDTQPPEGDTGSSAYNFGYDGKAAIRMCENFADLDWNLLDFFDQSVAYLDIVNLATCPWKDHSQILSIASGPKQLVEIRGKFFPAPVEAEALLTLHYGSEWRTPREDYSPHGGSGCR